MRIAQVRVVCAAVMRVLLFCSLFLTSCGASESGDEVTFHSGEPLAAAVEIDGMWHTLPANADTKIAVGGPYSLTTVCSIPESTQVALYTALLAPADGDEIWLPCGWVSDEIPVALTIELVTSAQVRIGWKRLDRFEPTDEFAPGDWDVFAFTDTRYLIERDVSITEPFTLEIDVGRDGKALETRDVIVDGAPADPTMINASLSLVSEHVTHVDLGTTLPLHVVPPADLEPEDRQLVWANKMQDGSWLSATGHVADGPVELVLPMPIAEVHGSYDDVPTATWRYDGPWTNARMLIQTPATDLNSLSMQASANWIAATGTTNTLVGVDVREMPGVDPAWLTGATVASVELENQDPDGPNTRVRRSLSSP